MRNSRYLLACVVTALTTVCVLGIYDQHLKAADQPAPITKESSSAFRAVVKKTLPAVVSVAAKTKTVNVATEDGEDFGDPGSDDGQIPEELRRFFGGRRGFRTPPPSPGGFGSGVIVDASGIVLTNNHVVAGAERVEVGLQDGRKFTSEEIYTDPKTDLAIIKLSPEKIGKLPVAELGDSRGLEIGDWVLAMGAPFQLHGTVTAGIVSAKGRALQMNPYEDFIQTDAAINPGNSGGPIVDLDGKVVGINTAIRSNSGGFEGVGFAIPVNMAREVMNDLVAHGKVRRGYLGIQMTVAEKPLLNRLGLEHGVQITQLTPGETPARKARLQPVDIIIEVDGVKIVNARVLRDLVADTEPGTAVDMTIFRDGAQTTVSVTIDEQPEMFGITRPVRGRFRRPPSKPETADFENLGVKVQELTPALAQRFGYSTDKGVLVTRVAPDSPADRAGLQPGVLIVQTEDKAVHSPAEFAEAINDIDLDKKGVLVKVRLPNGGASFIVIEK